MELIYMTNVIWFNWRLPVMSIGSREIRRKIQIEVKYYNYNNLFCSELNYTLKKCFTPNI